MDYHSVAQGSASAWLGTFLNSLRTGMAEKVIVLIIPPTFALRVALLQQPVINAYVDLFVLKYFDTNSPDYNTYASLFVKSNNYPGTAFLELQANPQVWLDTCKTVIAKPTTSTFDRTSGNFIDSTSLWQAFTQLNLQNKWFGGFANLDFEGDSSLAFQLTVLQGMRSSCYSSGNCVCK